MGGSENHSLARRGDGTEFFVFALARNTQPVTKSRRPFRDVRAEGQRSSQPSCRDERPPPATGATRGVFVSHVLCDRNNRLFARPCPSLCGQLLLYRGDMLHLLLQTTLSQKKIKCARNLLQDRRTGSFSRHPKLVFQVEPR